MGMIRKFTSVSTMGMVSYHSPKEKTANATAKAARAQAKRDRAEARLLEAQRKMIEPTS